MPRLLIVKTSSLGDVIHNLPIVHDIRLQRPDIQIDWVVEESFADILHLHPDVDTIHSISLRRWRKHLLTRQTWHELADAKDRIASADYDLVLDTQGLIKSALVCRWSKGRRMGYSRQSAREPIAALAYQSAFTVAKNLHAVQRNRLLAAKALGYPDPTTPPIYGIHAQSHQPILNTPYVMGFHATSRDSKLWPTKHWIGFGKWLATQQLSIALPWGHETEKQRAQEIVDALPGNGYLLPKMRLRDLASVTQQAIAAVGVDTGLSHLAVALQRPTLALYTDTNPALTGVYAGLGAPAINLGAIGQTPSVEAVIHSFHALLTQEGS